MSMGGMEINAHSLSWWRSTTTFISYTIWLIDISILFRFYESLYLSWLTRNTFRRFGFDDPNTIISSLAPALLTIPCSCNKCKYSTFFLARIPISITPEGAAYMCHPKDWVMVYTIEQNLRQPVSIQRNEKTRAKHTFSNLEYKGIE